MYIYRVYIYHIYDYGRVESDRPYSSPPTPSDHNVSSWFFFRTRLIRSSSAWNSFRSRISRLKWSLRDSSTKFQPTSDKVFYTMQYLSGNIYICFQCTYMIYCTLHMQLATRYYYYDILVFLMFCNVILYSIIMYNM